MYTTTQQNARNWRLKYKRIHLIGTMHTITRLGPRMNGYMCGNIIQRSCAIKLFSFINGIKVNRITHFKCNCL